MEAEKLERFKRTVLTDKELYVAFSDVQMRYKSVILLHSLPIDPSDCLDFEI